MGITRIRGELQVKKDSLRSDAIKDGSIIAADISVGALTGDLFANGTILALKIDVETLAGTGLILNVGNNRLDVDADLGLLQSFNGANELVQLDGAGALPAIDGSALTGISGVVGATTDLTDVGGAVNEADGLVKLTGGGILPILDGSNLTNVSASPITFVDLETPTGVLNGVNVTYALSLTPTAGTLHLYQNGMLLAEGAGNDYTIAGGTITMLTPPLSDHILVASYRA